jgi:Tol biopolymer transport system component
MRFNRIFILLSVLVLALSACADIYSLPSVAVSSDGQWVSLVASEEFASRFSLKVVNVQDGSVINIGEDGHQQGAFDWHPTLNELAYFNLDADGVPTIRTTSIDTPESGVDIFGALAFPGAFWVNQLAYSPDGTKLAIAALLLPFDAVIDPNQPFSVNDVQGVLYIGDLATGQVENVSPTAVAPTTAVWSPDGSKIAYMAWADDNQDGLINITADPTAGQDRYRVFTYDVATGETNPINDPSLHSSPTWLDNNQTLALVTSPLDANSGNNSIISYNLSTQMATPIRPADGQTTVLGINAADDGSQLAFTTVPQGTDMSTVTQASTARVINIDGSGESAIYTADGTTGILDIPVWSPDGTQLFLSTGNPPSAKLTAFAEHNEDIMPQQLIVIDVNQPDNMRVIYQGTVASTGLLQFNMEQ